MRYRTEFDQTQNYVKYFNNNKSVSMEKNTSLANFHSLLFLFLQDTLPLFGIVRKDCVVLTSLLQWNLSIVSFQQFCLLYHWYRHKLQNFEIVRVGGYK